ncbi:MAG TPA: TonB family protein [Planctomycetota bacterium]|nr:TonB family protein [Planctomycetota bacterium]
MISKTAPTNGTFVPPPSRVRTFRPTRPEPARTPRPVKGRVGLKVKVKGKASPSPVVDTAPGEAARHWTRALRGGAIVSVLLLLALAWTQPRAEEGRDAFLGEWIEGSREVPFLLELKDGPLAPPSSGEWLVTAVRKPEPGAEAAVFAGQARGPVAVVEDRSAVPVPEAAIVSRRARGGDASRGSIRREAVLRGPAVAASRDLSARRRTSVAVALAEVKAAAPKPPVVAVAPRPTYQPRPPFPEGALKAEKEGFVRLKILISTTGTVEKYEVVAGENVELFEDSIKKVISTWRYAPARDDSGKPVQFWEDHNYVFKLQVGA